MNEFLERIFHLSKNNTNVKTELIAGFTTFMGMAYILAVNPDILSATGMDKGAVFTATALAAVFGTLAMNALNSCKPILCAMQKKALACGCTNIRRASAQRFCFVCLSSAPGAGYTLPCRPPHLNHITTMMTAATSIIRAIR